MDKPRHTRPSGLTYNKKEPKKNKSIGIRLSEQDLEKLNKYAELTNKSVATCARDLITNALNLIPLD